MKTVPKSSYSLLGLTVSKETNMQNNEHDKQCWNRDMKLPLALSPTQIGISGLLMRSYQIQHMPVVWQIWETQFNFCVVMWYVICLKKDWTLATLACLNVSFYLNPKMTSHPKLAVVQNNLANLLPSFSMAPNAFLLSVWKGKQERKQFGNYPNNLTTNRMAFAKFQCITSQSITHFHIGT